jgi:hypothetical protein
VRLALYPVVGIVDDNALKGENYLNDVINQIIKAKRIYLANSKSLHSENIKKSEKKDNKVVISLNTEEKEKEKCLIKSENLIYHPVPQTSVSLPSTDISVVQSPSSDFKEIPNISVSPNKSPLLLTDSFGNQFFHLFVFSYLKFLALYVLFILQMNLLIIKKS